MKQILAQKNKAALTIYDMPSDLELDAFVEEFKAK